MARNVRAGGQDAHAAAQNREFFAHDERYARRNARLAITRNTRDALNRQLEGARRVLDVGNGGVFDYDTSLATEIVAVDLFLDELPPERFPPNVVARRGSALDLPEPDGAYDVVLLSYVIHHLVGESADDVDANTVRALAEATRVLRPGGRLVVVESCVPKWFHRFERRAFGALRRLSTSRWMHHPPTLQLPSDRIAEIMRARLRDVRVERIAAGWVLLQFGVRWPTILTPARPWAFVATKDQGG